MEQHIAAQRDGQAETVITELRLGCGQLGLKLSVGASDVERVAEGTQDLQDPCRACQCWIKGGDATGAGHRESLALAFGLAGALAERKGQSDQHAGLKARATAISHAAIVDINCHSTS